MPEAKEADAEKKRELDIASAKAALEVAALPMLVSRFEVIPGPPPHITLVLGGAYSVEMGVRDEAPENVINVKMHGAYALNRQLASDIAVKLQAIFNLTDEEMKEAWKRSDRAANA